jgi:hypothetical protein
MAKNEPKPKLKRWELRIEITRGIPIDVSAPDKMTAEKLAKQKTEKGDHLSPPVQNTPHIKVKSVRELPDDWDREEIDRSERSPE